MGGCRLRGLASKAEPAAAEPVAADIEFELDRDDPECADKSSLWEAPRAAPLEPVDLDTEFDRDDPELADKRNLWEAPPPPELVDLETEFDRDDPEMADKKTLWEAPQARALESVDLDTEFDRDDPEMADKAHLWDAPEPPRPANIDAELDLMEEGEKAVPRAAAGMTEPKPTVPGESPGGTLAGNTPYGQGGRRTREEPDPRIGQFREARTSSAKQTA
ncbi:hypothetical protein ABPG75_002588 [Micractinium tetrahymenae]